MTKGSATCPNPIDQSHNKPVPCPAETAARQSKRQGGSGRAGRSGAVCQRAPLTCKVPGCRIEQAVRTAENRLASFFKFCNYSPSFFGGCWWHPPQTLFCMGHLIMCDPSCFSGNFSHHSRTNSFPSHERQSARQGRRLHPASAVVSGAAQYFNQEMIANFILSTHRHARRRAKSNRTPWVLLRENMP